jgi:hypothetical protein
MKSKVLGAVFICVLLGFFAVWLRISLIRRHTVYAPTFNSDAFERILPGQPLHVVLDTVGTPLTLTVQTNFDASTRIENPTRETVLSLGGVEGVRLWLQYSRPSYNEEFWDAYVQITRGVVTRAQHKLYHEHW